MQLSCTVSLLDLAEINTLNLNLTSWKQLSKRSVSCKILIEITKQSVYKQKKNNSYETESTIFNLQNMFP